jgi:hypothetical protein
MKIKIKKVEPGVKVGHHWRSWYWELSADAGYLLDWDYSDMWQSALHDSWDAWRIYARRGRS